MMDGPLQATVEAMIAVALRKARRVTRCAMDVLRLGVFTF